MRPVRSQSIRNCSKKSLVQRGRRVKILISAPCRLAKSLLSNTDRQAGSRRRSPLLEQQLRNVLESCGLTEHCDFETEVSRDDTAAADETLAMGLPVYTTERDTPANHVIRSWPDGHRELLFIADDGAKTVVNAAA